MDRVIKAAFQHTAMGLAPVFRKHLLACGPDDSNLIRNTPFVMLR